MAEADSDEDLTKELQPLAYHVSDRKRVLKEAFKSLKGKRLEAMIPPLLKSWDRPKLESACLAILENLDDETLLAVLDGRVGTAGVAAVEQSSPKKESAVKGKGKSKKLKFTGDVLAEASDDEEPKKKKKKKASAEGEDEVKAAKIKKKKKLAKAKLKEKAKKKKKAAAVAAESGEGGAAPPHKSLMELLELEFRAKAIKALLRSQGQSVPDIPINLDDEGEEEKEKATTSATVVPNEVSKTKTVEVNGSTEEPASKKVKAVPPKAQQTTKASTKSKVSLEKETSKADGDKSSTPSKGTKPKPSSAPIPEVMKKPTDLQKSKPTPVTNSKKSPNKLTTGSKPSKKGVASVDLDLIHEALNTSITDVVTSVNPADDVEPISPPSVIADALVCKDKSEEDLRLKLLQRYQQKRENSQSQSQSSPLSQDSGKKKRKKKKAHVELKEQEEDILDLHPPELSLTDEEPGVEQTTENDESSEYESSDEENDKEDSKPPNPESDDTSHQSTLENFETDKSEVKQKTVEETEKCVVGEEELDYSESEEKESEKEDVEDDPESNMSDKNSEVNEDKLWDDVQKGKEDSQDSSNSKVDEEVEDKGDIVDNDQDQDVPSEQPSDNESKSNEGPISENSRSGVFSETTRDDVFETAKVSEDKSLGVAVTFNTQGQSLLKRKITFRIDPARIGALEEKAVEEEAKRAEERKRIEEEDRLAREAAEPEEGEIDSDEDVDEGEGQDQGKNDANPSRSPSLSPIRNHPFRRNSDRSSDSDGSQGSTSYYSRRRKHSRRVSASPPKDFGRYSPKKPSQDEAQKESPTKRPSSPVEFITQFSDMESISDEDSNDSNPAQRKRKKPMPDTVEEQPLQGCAGKPENDEEDGKEKDNPESEQENEEELPKPVTWYERWAQSRGIQKVVKTNNIQKKVRKKLKEVKSSTKKMPEVPKEPEPSVEAEPIIGSIEEYEKLFGKKVVVDADNSKSNDDSGAGNVDDNNDDDEADDLWGDIIGGSGSE